MTSFRPCPEKCTFPSKKGCSNEQDRFDYSKWKWKPACSGHRRTRREAVELEGREYEYICYGEGEEPDELHVDKNIAFDAESALEKSSTREELERSLKAYAEELRDELWEATAWRFNNGKWTWRTYGASQEFYCSQDLNNQRRRDGRARKRVTDKKRDGHRSQKFACRGSFTVAFHLNSQYTNIRLNHHCSHHDYRGYPLQAPALERIRQLWEDQTGVEPSAASSIHAKLMSEDFSLDITTEQVRHELGKLKALKFGARPKDETAMEEAQRLLMQVEGLEEIYLSEEDSWNDYWEVVAVAVTVPEGEKLREAAIEIAVDGTHGKIKGWELLGVLAEDDGSAYPISYLALRPSPNRVKLWEGKAKPPKEYLAFKNTRFDVMRCWFGALKNLGLKPKFSHLDKDFSEISAVQMVWPQTSVQICLWHMKKAVDRRLARPKNEKRTPYYALDAQMVIPHLRLDFVPASGAFDYTARHSNYVIRSNFAAYRSLGPSSVPFPPSSSAFPPPHPTTGPRPPPNFTTQIPPLSSKPPAIHLSGVYTDGDPSSAPTGSGGPLTREGGSAGYARKELDDSVILEDWDEELREWGEQEEGEEAAGEEGDGWDFPMTATEERAAKEAAARKTAKLKESSSVICPQAIRGRIVTLMQIHTAQHPLIPFPLNGYLTANAIYLRAAAEMYDFCEAEDLAEAWAYLWEHWYRPARWILWARSSCAEISFWRTTMGIERHWRLIKAELKGQLISVGGAMVHLAKKTVPGLYAKLRRTRLGTSRQDWRLGQPRWRQEFKALYDRVWEDEEKAKKAVRKQRGQPELEEDEEVEASEAESESSVASEDIDLDPPPKKLSKAPQSRPPRPTRSLTPTLSLAEIARLDQQPLDVPSLRASHLARTLLDLSIEPTSTLDPSLSTYDAITAAEANLPEPKELTYGTDPAQGVCTCKSFLLSRFLICKHLIRLHTRHSRPPLYFKVVKCQRRGRRYVVPPSAIEVERLLKGNRSLLNNSATVQQLRDGVADLEAVDGAGAELQEPAVEARRWRGEGVEGGGGGGSAGRLVAGRVVVHEEGEGRRAPAEGAVGQPSSSTFVSPSDPTTSDNEEQYQQRDEQRRRLLKRFRRRMERLCRVERQLEHADDLRGYEAFDRRLGKAVDPVFKSMGEVKGGADAEARSSKGRLGGAGAHKTKKQKLESGLELLSWVDSSSDEDEVERKRRGT